MFIILYVCAFGANGVNSKTWTKQSWKWTLSKEAAILGSLAMALSNTDMTMSLAWGQEN